MNSPEITVKPAVLPTAATGATPVVPLAADAPKAAPAVAPVATAPVK